MRKKSKEIICLMMVFFVLFSGMCLETIETDSSLAYNFTDTVISYMDTHEAVAIESEVCATENIGIRNSFFVQQPAKRTMYCGGKIKGSLHLSYIKEVLQPVSNFFAATNVIELPELHDKIAVLNYIHNQDGKKRI